MSLKARRVCKTSSLTWQKLVLGLLSCFFVSTSAAGPAIPILMYSEHVEALSRVDQVNCDTINHYPGGNQILNEWLLLCQAFRLGGIHDTFEFVSMPSQERALKELIKGNALMPGFTLWERQHNPKHFALTPATLKKGEFTKALYTSMNNKGKFEALGADGLRQLSVLVNSSWSVDIDALSCFRNTYFTGTSYPNMLKMVADNKTNLMLHNLAHRSDFVHKRAGVELAVVEGYLVALPDSLHFMMNKSYPGAAKYLKALEQGLKILREQGRIKQAYRSVAFYNNSVKNWKVIQCIGNKPH